MCVLGFCFKRYIPYNSVIIFIVLLYFQITKETGQQKVVNLYQE